jgi:release factor glutamine methyltransferase
MTVTEALRAATDQLSAITDTPRLDAELLMAHALGVSREAMLLSWLRQTVPDSFAGLIARRMAREPLAYITGTRDFWTISLSVGQGVLIPRPDSETLIEAAVAHFGRAGPQSVLDLGTGPGTLLLAALAEWPMARGLGIDTSEKALEYAAINADKLGLQDRAEFRRGDWTIGLGGRFDLILCNPPYVETGAALSPEVRKEPDTALFAGPDGLDDYRRLIPQLLPLLADNSIACVEIGATQARAVAAIATASGLEVRIRQDLGGRDRCLIFSAL